MSMVHNSMQLQNSFQWLLRLLLCLYTQKKPHHTLHMHVQLTVEHKFTVNQRHFEP